MKRDGKRERKRKRETTPLSRLLLLFKIKNIKRTLHALHEGLRGLDASVEVCEPRHPTAYIYMIQKTKRIGMRANPI